VSLLLIDITRLVHRTTLAKGIDKGLQQSAGYIAPYRFNGSITKFNRLYSMTSSARASSGRVSLIMKVNG
jgi:hypothetical protein